MYFKKLFSILLVFCFVPCIATAASTDNLIKNASFEQSEGSSFPSDWQNNYPKFLSLNTDAAYVKTGTKSLKLSTDTDNYPYTTQRISGLIQGAEYTYSAYVKTLATGTRAQIKFEWYDSNGKTIPATHSPSYNQYSGNDWGKIEGKEVAPENASYLLLRLRMYGVGTVYWDDLTFYKTKDPLKMLSLLTDDVFYYSDRVENGKVTVTLNTNFHKNLTGQAVTFEFLYEEEILKTESKTIAGDKVTFTFPMTWIAEEKTKYTIRCSLGDEVLSQNVYRYPRPAFIRKDGVYEENGEEFHPVYIYDIPDTSVLQEIKGAGINLVQGHVSWMDACEAQDMKQIVVLYAGSTSAGNDARLATTKKYVRENKDKDGVFAWAVKDEPNIKPSTLAELEKAYVAIRNIDDMHPVWINCNANIDTFRKYADVLSYDSYPYNNNLFSYQTAKGISDSVEKAKGKPVYSLLQAFDENASCPTPAQLGSMIYQSFWGGAKGVGFYKYKDAIDGKSLPKTELWETVLKFSQANRAAFSVFVKNKEVPIDKGESDDFYWYIKKMGSTYWLVAINKSSTASKTFEVTIDGISPDYQIMLLDGTVDAQIQITGSKLQISLPKGGYIFARHTTDTEFVNSEGETVTSGNIGEIVFPLRNKSAAFSILAAFRTNGDTEELTDLYIGENEVPFIKGIRLEENTFYKLYSWDKNMKPINEAKCVVTEKEENYD